MPKNVYGFRQINEQFKDINGRGRYYSGFRVMYGLSKRLTVMTMIGGSNHHLKKVPSDFTSYLLNHHKITYPIFPFLTEGVHGYAKYRILSIDREKKHFRVAIYSEVTKSFVAHTEGESNLMTDNSGYGGGLIFTKLYKRFAASFTSGFIKSLPYTQQNDLYKLTFKSGDVLVNNLSLGYRIYPRTFANYKDININLYAEIINRRYLSATIYYDGVPFDYSFIKDNGAIYTYNGFVKNQYTELRTSVQFIFNSTSRLDIGFAVPIISRSYLYDYPLVFINIQKYIFK